MIPAYMQKTADWRPQWLKDAQDRIRLEKDRVQALYKAYADSGDAAIMYDKLKEALPSYGWYGLGGLGIGAGVGTWLGGSDHRVAGGITGGIVGGRGGRMVNYLRRRAKLGDSKYFTV